MSVIGSEQLQGWRFIIFNISLGLGHAVVLFNAGAYIAMLPKVAGDLSIPTTVASWTQTDYMIGLALAFPVGIWTSRRMGEFRPFVLAFSVFGLASAMTLLCDSIFSFLALRVIMGFAGGMTLPLGQSLLLKEYPERTRTVGISVWNIFTLTPFTFGPAIGGVIADHFGWRALFLINVPVAIVIAGTVWALLYGRGYEITRNRFDWSGFVLFAISIGALQSMLNQGNDWDWSNSIYIRSLFIIGIVCWLYWVVMEEGVDYPFLDISLFRQRNFLVGVMILSIGFLFFQGLLSLLIVQLQVNFGYSSMLAGLVFLPLAIFAKPIANVIQTLIKYTDARMLASINLLGFAFTYFWLSNYDHVSDLEEIIWPKLLEGICLGSFLGPLTALLLHGLPEKRHLRAVELASTIRITAGAFGISLQGIIIYFRTPFHTARLSEDYSYSDERVLYMTEILSSAGMTESAIIKNLATIMQQQATLWAINEAYWFAGCVFVFLAAAVWLAHPTRQPKRNITKAIKRKTLSILAKEV